VIVGVVCAAISGTGLFFLWGQITSKEEQTAATTAKTQQLQNESTQLTAQIQQAGVKKDYTAAADAAVQSVLTSLQKRVDHPRVGREIYKLVPAKDMWIESITIGGDAASADGAGTPIKITGVGRDFGTLMGFQQRINTSSYMTNAVITDSELAADRKNKWMSFTLDATLNAESTSSAPTGDASLVSSQSDSSASSLAYEPSPNFGKNAKKKKKAAAAKKTADAAAKAPTPLTPFEQIAAGKAGS
jgi:Tfp pilus assembly protein PilN